MRKHVHDLHQKLADEGKTTVNQRGLGDGHNFEEVSGLAEGRVGSEDCAEVSDHEIVFRTRSHDAAVIITVRRPD